MSAGGYDNMTADRLVAGRYRLGDPIGTGAMGVVWRASDVRLRRTVAVKQLILAPGLTKAQALEAKMRAMREGRIAARLHHQNAVTVFDVAEEDGQPWLVMEFVDAPSLAALMRDKGPMDPQEVARIGAKVAGALAAAHAAGIVHRDVKPANILVADDGTVKITDFGISRAVGDVTVTSTGFLAGTPAYLSPEVARGENPEPSSDVFALGSTLYAAVEGTPPFGEGDNPLAVLHSVARAQVNEPKRAGTLGPVLMTLLAAEAADRPTMKQAREAMEAVAEGRAAELPRQATRVLPKTAAAVDTSAATTVLSGARPAGDAAAATVHIAADSGSGGTTPAAPAAPQANSDGAGNRKLLLLAGAGVLVVLVIVGLIAVLTRGGDGGSHSVAAGRAPAASSVAAPPAEGGAPVPGGGQAGGVQSGGGQSGGSQAGSAQPGGGAAATTTPAPPSTSGSATPTPTPSAPSSAPPSSAPRTTVTTTPFGPAAPPAANLTGFVYSYYGALPGNTSSAWAMLSPGYQASTGGYQAYASWWSTIASVSVNSVTQTGPDMATAALTYRKKDGTVTSESRWLRVDSSGGRMLITGSGT
ncbi:serine/threonine-protein kinase [Nocardia terpenica]|uniref:serine/threonine-protein kinase n=1 Tax=Nocardia terpenica TaxID=455432 RepID=UPI002B4B1C9D|nr:serine/threonine-protein kinase [Nocardia terpenica]